MNRKWLWRGCLAAVLLALAPAASAQEPAASGGVDVSALGLGQEVARAAHGGHLYVALASGGVAVIDVRDAAAPKVVQTLLPERRFVRVVVDNGLLLLIEEQSSVWGWNIAGAGAPQALASLSPGAASPPPIEQPPPSAEVAAAAQVLKVEAGRVLFDAGRGRGFEPGARVRVVSQALVEKPDLVTGETRRVPSGEVTAVVQIEHADQTRSLASLGRGDVVEPGDTASVTTEPLSEKLLIPRRAPFAWRFGFHARPFLGLNSSGKPFALLADAYVTYFFPNLPLVAGLEVTPAGLTTGGSHAFPVTANAFAAFESDYFELGLGVGGVTSGGVSGVAAAEGLTLNQLARLGALDGINLTLRTWINVSAQQFSFAGMRGEANIPMTSRVGLFGGGGAGANGWTLVDVGVRTTLGGVGAAGTTTLSASLGYASIQSTNASVGGPTVAFGLEWRR